MRLTEVEAYGGSDDPASHAYRGRTDRNASMFLGAGHLYVYRSYGLHMMANIVTGDEGHPGAVLLRAGDPIEGIDIMEQRRARSDHLCDGPGKLAQALGLTLQHDGLAIGADPIDVVTGHSPSGIASTPRIGISRGTQRPWRFIASA